MGECGLRFEVLGCRVEGSEGWGAGFTVLFWGLGQGLGVEGYEVLVSDPRFLENISKQEQILRHSRYRS